MSEVVKSRLYAAYKRAIALADVHPLSSRYLEVMIRNPVKTKNNSRYTATIKLCRYGQSEKPDDVIVSTGMIVALEAENKQLRNELEKMTKSQEFYHESREKFFAKALLLIPKSKVKGFRHYCQGVASYL